MPTSEQLKHALARNVRECRAARGWSLSELAIRSAVSRAMIVQVEAGRTNASLGTICQLADALGVPVPALISDDTDARVRVIHAEDAPVMWEDGDGSFARLLSGTSAPEKLEVWSWRLVSGAEYSSKAHPIGTREIIWVQSGVVDVDLGPNTFSLRKGDSISFAAEERHCYRNPKTTPCTFGMVVQMPRTERSAATTRSR